MIIPEPAWHRWVHDSLCEGARLESLHEGFCLVWATLVWPDGTRLRMFYEKEE